MLAPKIQDQPKKRWMPEGVEKASKIKVKASVINKMKNMKKMAISMKKFDYYLKFFNFNPGTCADLTVTTLLISKIRDIFKFQI